MAEKVRRLDEMDPHSGRGDIDFKRAVLGATAILADQPPNIRSGFVDRVNIAERRFYEHDTTADFSLVGVKDESGKDVVGYVEGAIDYDEEGFSRDDKLKINTHVTLPQGNYYAEYEEKTVRADEGDTESSDEDVFVSGHGAGRVSRIVPTEQLPKRDQKLIDDESKRRQRDSVPIRLSLDNANYIPVHVAQTLEAEREYVAKKEERAKAKRGSGGKTYYTKTIKDPRAAEIINHQVAKHLRSAAEQVRQRAIDEIKSIDLGD